MQYWVDGAGNNEVKMCEFQKQYKKQTKEDLPGILGNEKLEPLKESVIV